MMKNLIYILLVGFFLVSCDEGDPAAFSPEEKIVTIQKEADLINNGDEVKININIEVNIDPTEQAEVYFFDEKGTVFFQNEEILSGETIVLDTTNEMFLVYVPNSTESDLSKQKHKIQVRIVGKTTGIGNIYSADSIGFFTVENN